MIPANIPNWIEKILHWVFHKIDKSCCKEVDFMEIARGNQFYE